MLHIFPALAKGGRPPKNHSNGGAVKKADLSRANELHLEANARLGEFSKKLEKGNGNRFTTNGVSIYKEITKLGKRTDRQKSEM